jgi:Ca2+-binding RTX toxin-like protein
MSTIKGNSYAHTLNGTSSADYIYGYGGNDTLNGYGGSDHLYGGDGSDHLNGGSGTDYLYGNAGNDYLNGGSGSDYLFGGDGNDVSYVDFQDILDGGAGFDTISFEKHTSAVSFYSDPEFYDSLGGNWQGIEKVKGSPYDDSMVVRNHPGIVVDDAGGNDTLLGEGPITLYGGSGNDDLIWRGTHGANGTVGYGCSGNDHLNMMDMTGGTGNDTFDLMAYNDVTMPGEHVGE